MSDTQLSFVLLLFVAILLLLLMLLSRVHSLGTLIREALTRLNERDSREKMSLLGRELDRRANRFKYRAPANALTAEATVSEKPIAVSAEDISETGLLVRVEQETAFEVGGSYPIRIKFPDGEFVRTVMRIVREVEPKTRFGACFEDLSIESKKRLREYVQSQARDELKSDI